MVGKIPTWWENSLSGRKKVFRCMDYLVLRHPSYMRGFTYPFSLSVFWFGLRDVFFKNSRSKLKIKNLLRLMAFSRPIQWFHSHADPIWLDGTFNEEQ
jgi:hypothetical protein